MEQDEWQKRKVIISFAVFIVALTLFLYNFYQIPVIKNEFPWVDNQIRAYKYERIARKLPPSNMQAKRLKAMAEAIRKGQKDYSFETGPVPGIGR